MLALKRGKLLLPGIAFPEVYRSLRTVRDGIGIQITFARRLWHARRQELATPTARHQQPKVCPSHERAVQPHLRPTRQMGTFHSSFPGWLFGNACIRSAERHRRTQHSWHGTSAATAASVCQPSTRGSDGPVRMPRSTQHGAFIRQWVLFCNLSAPLVALRHECSNTSLLCCEQRQHITDHWRCQAERAPCLKAATHKYVMEQKTNTDIPAGTSPDATSAR